MICPNLSEESATLYQHCVRAIERGLKFGEHGLPLMGCGDWNDGMNRVGYGDGGVKVSPSWHSFFMTCSLSLPDSPAPHRMTRPLPNAASPKRGRFNKNIEQHAWDGQWYRRAYFDNGDPLGSQTNPECQIDSLPQSWSVISGAGDPLRSRNAMESVDQRLVRRNAGLIQLFAPPFDKSPLNPGYIKGYMPGVRENEPIHPRRDLDRHGLCTSWRTANAPGTYSRSSIPFITAEHAEPSAIYKVEPYVVAADVYARRAAHRSRRPGPITPGQPAGCIGCSSKRCWA